MPDAPVHPDNYLTASAVAVARPSIVSRSRRSARLRGMIAYDADMIGADRHMIAHYLRFFWVLPAVFLDGLGRQSSQKTAQAYLGGRP